MIDMGNPREAAQTTEFWSSLLDEDAAPRPQSSRTVIDEFWIDWSFDELGDFDTITVWANEEQIGTSSSINSTGQATGFITSTLATYLGGKGLR